MGNRWNKPVVEATSTSTFTNVVASNATSVQQEDRSVVPSAQEQQPVVEAASTTDVVASQQEDQPVVEAASTDVVASNASSVQQEVQPVAEAASTDVASNASSFQQEDHLVVPTVQEEQPPAAAQFPDGVEQEDHSVVATAQEQPPLAAAQFPDGRPKMRSKPRPPSKYCCGTCEACMVDDCGDCRHCRDKPRFGGPFRLKQACQNRPPCLAKASPDKKTNKKQKANKKPKNKRVQQHPVSPQRTATLVWFGTPSGKLGDAPWPPGWKQEIEERPKTNTSAPGHRDNYYYTPVQKYRLRSIPDVHRFLQALRTCGGDEDQAILHTVQYGKNKRSSSKGSKKRKGGLFAATEPSKKNKKSNRK